MFHKYNNSDINFLCGSLTGTLPIVFMAIAFGDGFRKITLIFFAVIAVIMFLLTRSSTINDHKEKSITSLVFYFIMLFVSDVTNMPGKVFAMMNPTYGPPNAGDGFGMVFVIMPLSFGLVIVMLYITRMISKKENCDILMKRS